MTLREHVLIAGRYLVRRQIGAGGMGAVWLATDQQTGRDIALKRAHPGKDREISAAANAVRDIHHPHIVELFDVVSAEGESWLVMEYVPSRDLAAIIAADGMLSTDRVARIGRQVAEALDVLHTKGIVHGDVSPGNVLVSHDDDAKLTDFGVSRAIWSDATLTSGTLVPATPAYLAPEVARGGERTPASDIFSLGATLFAAAEGVSPLGQNENPLSAVWRAASGHVSAPSAGPLGNSLSSMLAVDPAKRPNAALVAETLGHGPAHSPHRRRFLVGTAIAAVVVIVAAVFVTRSLIGNGAPKNSATVGNAHTADLCALVKPADFKRYGQTELSPDYGNFNRCDVLISKNSDDLGDIEVTLSGGPQPGPAKSNQVKHDGAVTVISQSQQDGECDRLVLLPGGDYAVVSAKLTGSGSMPLCPAADIATKYAVSVFNKGPIPRRTSPWPRASLANADACGLLTSAAVGRIAGMPHTNPEPDFGRWDCYWDNGAPLSAEVRFDRNSPLDPRDGQPVKLHGVQAFISPESDGPNTCVAQLVHRTYTDSNGDPAEDLVQVVVSGGRPMRTLCADARSLGSIVAMRTAKIG
jgi:hypothetical protein